MKVLLKAESTDRVCVPCDYALAHLEHKDLNALRRRRAAFLAINRVDPDAFYHAYWDEACKFYRFADVAPAITHGQVTLISEQGFLVLPRSFEPLGVPINAECGRVVLDQDDFYYKAVVKAAEVYLTTSSLLFDAIAPRLSEA
jgi:hypothetical protein